MSENRNPAGTSSGTFTGRRVTRREFLRSAGIAGGAVAAAGLGLSGAARADGYSPTTGFYEVVPTGDPNQDPQKVQAAIDAAAPGSTILLKAGRFDFGEGGRVYLKKDVTIMGEPGTVELEPGRTADRTAIVGGGSAGFFDFAGPINCSLFMSPEPIDFTVTGIWFHRSRFCSIFADRSRSMIKIQNNKLTDLIGVKMFPDNFFPGMKSGNYAFGLLSGNNVSQLNDPSLGSGLKGEIIFDNNTVDYTPDPPYAGEDHNTTTYAYSGILVHDIIEQDTRVVVTNSDFRIDFGCAIGLPSVPHVLVENNVISPKTEGSPLEGGIAVYPHGLGLPGPSSATVRNNIVYGSNQPNFAGIGVWGAAGPVLIENNTIYDAIFQGISVGSYDGPTAPTVIQGNSVLGGFWIWAGITTWMASNVTVRNNTLGSGMAVRGIATDGTPQLTVNNNRISDNRISGFVMFGLYTKDSANVVLERNDLSGATCLFSQLFCGWNASGNSSRNNRFGSTSIPIGGVMCGWDQDIGNMISGFLTSVGLDFVGAEFALDHSGVPPASGNSFTNDNFLGNYPGWSNGSGCMLFTSYTQGNQVTALKNGVPMYGFDLCDQVFDYTDRNLWAAPYPGYDGDNSLPGYGKCVKPSPEFKELLRQKIEQKKIEMQGAFKVKAPSGSRDARP